MIKTSITDENGNKAEMPFTPRTRGFLKAEYNNIAGMENSKLFASMMYSGKQRLPENAYGMKDSPSFFTFDLTGTLRLGVLSFTVGAKNIFDTVQKVSPLQGTADPFQEAFLRNFLYGPLVGRTIVASMVVRWEIDFKMLIGLTNT